MFTCSLAIAGRLYPPKPQARLGLTSKVEFILQPEAKAKRQLAGNFFISETSIDNRCVVLESHQGKIINSPAPTPSPSDICTLAPTSSPAEGPLLPDTEPSDLILHPATREFTTPILVTPTSAPLVMDQLTPVPLSTVSYIPNSVKFGPGIEEALPYASMV